MAMEPYRGRPQSPGLFSTASATGNTWAATSGNNWATTSVRSFGSIRALSGHLSTRMKRSRLDATQVAASVLSVFLLFWSIAVSILLLVGANRYLFTTIDNSREWYVVQGSIAWAQAEASQVLHTAFRARDAVSLAIGAGLVSGSTDYAALERILAPTLATSPLVRGVELSFSDSPAVVVAGRGEAGDGRLQVTMQSNSADCFLLGMDGCIDAGVEGRRPSWYSQGAGLGGDDADGGAVWAGAPELVMRDSGTVTAVVISWYPSYRLLFRSAASDAGVSAVGRVTLEVGELSGSALQDKRLGPNGRVYLCDRNGFILASHAPQDILTVEPSSGAARFQYVWELDAGWSSSLVGKFGYGAGDFQEQTKDGAFVALSWLKEPLGHFAIVVAVEDTEAFANGTLLLASVVSFVQGLLPYGVLVLGLCIMVTVQQVKSGDQDDANTSTRTRIMRTLTRKMTKASFPSLSGRFKFGRFKSSRALSFWAKHPGASRASGEFPDEDD